MSKDYNKCLTGEISATASSNPGVGVCISTPDHLQSSEQCGTQLFITQVITFRLFVPVFLLATLPLRDGTLKKHHS